MVHVDGYKMHINISQKIGKNPLVSGKFNLIKLTQLREKVATLLENP